MLLIFVCVGIGTILPGETATAVTRPASPCCSPPDNLLGDGPTARDEDWVDNLEGAAKLLDQPDEDGDSTMEHSGIEDDRVRGNESVMPPPPPTAGGSDTSPTSTQFDGGFLKPKVLAPVGNLVCSLAPPASVVSGKYLAVRNFREGKLQFPDLCGRNSTANTDDKLNFYGSFRNEGDNRIFFYKRS